MYSEKTFTKHFLLASTGVLTLLTLIPVVLIAQLNIQTTISNTELIETLTGNAVKVDSLIINCDVNAYGKFSANQIINLPFTEGVLLTTGSVQAVARPANNSIAPGLIDYNLNTPGSPIIENLMHQSTFGKRTKTRRRKLY